MSERSSIIEPTHDRVSECEDCSSGSSSEDAVLDFGKNSNTPSSPELSTTSISDLPSTLTKTAKVYPAAAGREFGTEYLVFSQEEFLQFMEPLPVSPPSYDALPPGGCPRYPVMDNSEKDLLPQYTPAAYKIGICSRKLEWLSPYELSPSRSWKTFVMELNSTQVNFYSVPGHIESALLDLRPVSDILPLQRKYKSFDKNLMSSVTTDTDISFLKACDGLGFFKYDSVPIHQDEGEDYLLSGTSTNDTFSPSRLTSKSRQKRLVRSYSLQHAKVGLASDYSKKPNVLRLRLESEQFLIHFSTTRELIEWNLAFCVGRDVALDILDREIPKYRTVPRRRRNHLSGVSPSANGGIRLRRNRAHSDTQFEKSTSRIIGKFSKLKGKLSSLSSSSNLKTNQKLEPQTLNIMFQKNRQPSRTVTVAPVSAVTVQSVQREQGRRKDVRSNSVPAFSLADFEDDYDTDEPIHETIDHLTANYGDDDDEDGEEDIQNMSDLHRSDDEDDFDGYNENTDVGEQIARRLKLNSVSSSYAMGDHKWNPTPRIDSERRFIRDCLKCIKPLAFDETWVNKVLVKPSTFSPLSLSYFRCLYSTSLSSSSSSLASLSGSSVDLYSYYNTANLRRLSRETKLTLPDTSLARTANHNVKEYVAGSHALIPKDI